ncbi:hypothetical protein K4L44_05665 [Halosquirtibacter laminarini]|uniref:Uncharacterized protein n=1 Tax=Halosquirtibacter laminarini TaxID=3374600 RepID=A0AC61NPE0_9BACT|nr:hypothetical protein K4L44_05665 [Prolixibacteraceae bacterium]
MRYLFRSLFFTLFMSIYLNGAAQSSYGTIIDGQFVWQKVFQSTQSKETIKENMLMSMDLRKVHDQGNRMWFVISGVLIDHLGAGVSARNCPSALLYNSLRCHVCIDFKESKYRVTICNIKLEDISQSVTKEDSLGVLNLYYETRRIEKVLLSLKRSKLESKYINDTKQVIDHTFEVLFREKTCFRDDGW